MRECSHRPPSQPHPPRNIRCCTANTLWEEVAHKFKIFTIYQESRHIWKNVGGHQFRMIPYKKKQSQLIWYCRYNSLITKGNTMKYAKQWGDSTINCRVFRNFVCLLWRNADKRRSTILWSGIDSYQRGNNEEGDVLLACQRHENNVQFSLGSWGQRVCWLRCPNCLEIRLYRGERIQAKTDKDTRWSAISYGHLAKESRFVAKRDSSPTRWELI